MIYHSPKVGGKFTQIDNSVIRDKRLSLKARGLLAYMLSCNWELNARKLQQETGEKRTVIENALKELQEFGYLKIIKSKVKGKFTIEFNVYEQPIKEKSFLEQLRECEEELPF